MNARSIYLSLTLVVGSALPPSQAQTPAIKLPTPIAATAATSVPALVPYTGALDTKAPEAGITFLIYKEESGGEPLFTETQTVSIDTTGHYKVQLGATQPSGIPVELFSTGEARWLEVQIAGEKPQPRTLLASVPYALKAADSATLGGLPASAFALAGTTGASAASTSPSITRDGITTVTTTGGTANNLAVFSGTSTVINSILVDNGTGIGVGKPPSASAILDVNGPTILRGDVQLQRTGNATTSTGYNSHQFNFTAQAWDTATKGVVSPTFQWRAEPINNNTASPSATWNLLTTNGVASAAETGLYFNGNGTIHFASGQTFPGTGAGTITGVTAGTGLTGGGTSGTVTLAINPATIPELATANTYAASQTLSSGDINLPATTGPHNGVINIGNVPFLHGYSNGNLNTFVGGAGNFTTTGVGVTGIGYEALSSNTSGYFGTALGYQALTANTTGLENTGIGTYSLVRTTTGSYNTANGYEAMYFNTTGDQNTAIGLYALFQNTNGGQNTAVGVSALSDSSTGSGNTAVGYGAGANDSISAQINNATALGAHAAVAQSNSLVLGQTTAGSPGASYVNVGIGTATPRSALELAVNAPSALGPVLTLTNSGKGGSAIDFNTSQPAPGATYTPAARIVAYDNGTNDSGGGSSGIAMQSRAGQGLQNNLVVDGNGVHVPGALEAGVTNSRIDHPLDPANKYLVHSSVQSSEMMNIYTGNIVTDELGLATVKLPEWFEGENGDFRYQLTVLDERFAQAVVSKKIKNGQFTIHTNASNVEVSWQITAVRQDAYAKAHPLVVEQQKPASERSFYLHPELYGQSAERQSGASHIYGQPASAVNRTFTHPKTQVKPIRRPATNPTAAPTMKPIYTTKP